MKRFWFTFIAILGVWLASPPALAGENCDPFNFATNPNDELVSVVPFDYLSNRRVATICLIRVIDRFASRVNSVEDVDSLDVQFTLLSATSALRRMIADANAQSDTAGVSQELKDFIRDFRQNDSIDTISVLSYSARSSNRDLRLNSVLILGNIIDNFTVCVPLAHLNDSTLLARENGVNGRANLLGIVSVVAPWAYMHNFESIDRTVRSVERGLNQQDDSSQTMSIIKNIEVRLAAQDQSAAANKHSDGLDERSKMDCRAYIERFGSRITPEGKSSLKY